MRLVEMALQHNRELRDCLQEIFNTLNKGQTKQVLKNEMVARLVEKYRIEHK